MPKIKIPNDVLVLDWAELKEELKKSQRFSAVLQAIDGSSMFKPGFQFGQGQFVDAGTGNFFARQLEYVSRSVRSQLFAPKKWRAIVPQNPDQPGPAHEEYTYYQEKKAGTVKPSTTYSNTPPRAEVGLDGPFTSPIRPLTAMYAYSLQEVRAAELTGMNLKVRKAIAAREIVENGLNDTVIFGYPELKIPGFLTSTASVPIAEVQVGAVSTKKTWAEKIAAGNPEEVLADLNAMANRVAEQSEGKCTATTVLLPLAQFNLISSTPLSALSPQYTILKAFLENSPYVREVDWLPELKGGSKSLNVAGAAKDVAVCYERSPLVVSHICPIDYGELPPQFVGFETQINVEARCGGTNWERPLGGVFTYGI